MRESKNSYKGCLVLVLLPVVSVVAFILWGPDVSVPRAETRITLPDNRGCFMYRQKGIHYALVALQKDTNTEEHCLPFRPVNGSNTVYYYSSQGLHCVRLQDQCRESIIDLQTAKTYLLVRTPDEQLFRGEILACEDGSRCASINGSPWKVTIEGRLAEDITSSDMATNREMYIGHIDVHESKERPLDPPLVQFVPAKRGYE